MAAEEPNDIYSENWLEAGIESDELSSEEAGFMMGWLTA